MSVTHHQQSIQPARYAILDEFLVLEELNALADYARAREQDFSASRVVGSSDDGNSPYRRSRVLLETGRFHDLIAGRIRFYLPWILRAIKHSYFDISRVESQLTASNDGDYFRLHNDNTHADAPTREITYVYFFHSEPRPFHGGELVLYDSVAEDGASIPAGAGRRITPDQNTIVFFQSSCLHEILPVQCWSGKFADSRFTLNGWLHC